MGPNADYDRAAPTYDQIRFSGEPGQFLARADAAIIRDLFSMSGATTCLDVPVGTGRAIEYLHESPGQIIGCDRSRAMLDIASQRARERGRVELVQCDAAQLPFRSSSVECILCLGLFHLFPQMDRLRFAAEYCRVLMPGGHLICSFTNGWYAGGWNWLRRRRGGFTLHLLQSGELAALFPGWRLLARRGNYLPKQWLLSRLGPTAERLARWATWHPLLNRLCWTTFFLLRKDR